MGHAFQGIWLAALLALLPPETYRVTGRIVQSDGAAFAGDFPVVYLRGAITPFHRHTLAGRDGKFKFKEIPAGIYTLIAAVPRVGELRRTIEVGPSFADSKRTVPVTLTFDQPVSVERHGGVSAAELSVSNQARDEYKRGLNALASGDAKGAAARFERAVQISPQFAAAWNHLGVIAYQTREYQQAETYFRQALNQDPEAYSPLVNLGGVLLALNRVDESLSVNEAAVKAMPRDALANSQLGKSYFLLDRLEEAETYLKRAKELDPSHFSYPQVYLIQIYVKRNQLPAAIAEMEEFLRLHPDSDWAPRIREILVNARARLHP